jgi:hypothetical protein
MPKVKDIIIVKTIYKYNNDKVKQEFKIKPNLEKRKIADLNDILGVLKSLYNEFESVGPNASLNISGRLYNISKSLEKIAENIKK